MRKFTAILSALMLIISTTPAAFATVYSEGYFKYTIADESITITEYFGKEETVTVPAMIAGIPVNTIASGAFSGSGIKELNLLDTITSIESGAIDAGVVINYNSNLPSGGQENPQPNPPQPNLPGIIVNTAPPAAQNDIGDGEAADDITVTEETMPEDVTVTEPVAENKSQTEQPRQTEAQPTKPAQSDDSKPPQTNQSEQPEETATATAATTVTTTAQNAIEEVEIDLDAIKTEEVTTAATEASVDSTEETQSASAAVSDPLPAESNSPKPIAAIVVAAVAIAALALGVIIVRKKKK